MVNTLCNEGNFQECNNAANDKTIHLILSDTELNIAKPRSSLFENWMVMELMIDRHITSQSIFNDAATFKTVFFFVAICCNKNSLSC